MLPNPIWAALNSSSFSVACITAIVLVTGTACLAQVAGGTISGSVRDSSGREIAGAQVAIKNAETALLRSTDNRQRRDLHGSEFDGWYCHAFREDV